MSPFYVRLETGVYGVNVDNVKGKEALFCFESELLRAKPFGSIFTKNSRERLARDVFDTLASHAGKFTMSLTQAAEHTVVVLTVVCSRV